MNDRSRVIYVLKLIALPHVEDPIRALRQALKVLLRRFGLRCISLEQTTEQRQTED
jgi:hypothetical protein